MSSGWSVTAVRYATRETTRSDAYYRYQAYGEPDGPQRMDYVGAMRAVRGAALALSDFVEEIYDA